MAGTEKNGTNAWIKISISIVVAALALAAAWGATRSEVKENTKHIAKNTVEIEKTNTVLGVLDDEVDGQHTDLAVLQVQLKNANEKLDKLLER